MHPAIYAAFAGHSPDAVRRGVALSLLDTPRLVSVGECLQATRDVAGDTAEVGIASGGTTKLIALANGGRAHWACDTFDGLVDVGVFDVGLTNKMFQNVLPPVREALASSPNVRMVQGYFPESAPPEMAAGRFAFVHIDVDTYQSIINCFDFFAPRMAPGGLIAVDDVLDASGCPGAQRAWGEILARRSGWLVVAEAPPQVVVRFG